MEIQISNQTNIAEQIIDGSIPISSLEDFEKIIKLFPDDPVILRAYSDMLAEQNLLDPAAKSYGKAAGLYIDAGMMLQAIVAKLLQWRISSPSYQEARLFFSALREGSYPITPQKIFFDTISHPEMLGIIYRLEAVQLPAGQIVKKAGDMEDGLYFIVSGTLKETFYQPVNDRKETVYRKSSTYLYENDFFGDILPLNQEKISQSYAETTTQVELAKISKESLVQVCQKYPNIEVGLTCLYDTRSESGKIGFARKIRRGHRHQLPIKMTLEIYPQATTHYPIIVEGYSRDISIGGICIVLEEIDESVSLSIASFHATVEKAKIQIIMPSEALVLKVSGTIVWSRQVYFKGKKTLALGVQFNEMSPRLRGMLFAFADSLGNAK
jgi:hypothetical protein